MIINLFRLLLVIVFKYMHEGFSAMIVGAQSFGYIFLEDSILCVGTWNFIFDAPT